MGSAAPASGAAQRPPVPLSQLTEGSRGRLLSTELEGRDREILSALGFATGCRFRICRAGDPWIVQVKSTRIGLANEVARRVLVLPE